MEPLNNPNQTENNNAHVTHEKPAPETTHTTHSAEHETHHSVSSENGTLMGILAYLGILIIIPYFVAKENPFVKFHIKQGLLLVIIQVVLSVSNQIIPSLFPMISILQLLTFVLTVIGIINVVKKKEKVLPVIGVYAKNFKI